jgi:hypothetical protein
MDEKWGANDLPGLASVFFTLLFVLSRFECTLFNNESLMNGEWHWFISKVFEE